MAETTTTDAQAGEPAYELAGELAALGVTDGTTLLVHASLHDTGLDADTLRTALLTALGPDGTLVVPAFTEENSDTSAAHFARIQGMTRRQAAAFRATMPAFDPLTTPCAAMGRLAESVRTAPGAVRSTHPQTSFAAIGRRAEELLALPSAPEPSRGGLTARRPRRGGRACADGECGFRRLFGIPSRRIPYRRSSALLSLCGERAGQQRAVGGI